MLSYEKISYLFLSLNLDVPNAWISLLLFCKQSEFIEKDNDALHSDLEKLIQDSKDAFLKSLFPGVVQKKTEIGSMTFGGAIKPSSKKLGFISVGSKFRVTFSFTHLFCFILSHMHNNNN